MQIHQPCLTAIWEENHMFLNSGRQSTHQGQKMMCIDEKAAEHQEAAVTQATHLGSDSCMSTRDQ